MSILHLYKLRLLYLFLCFYRLESRISADIRTILQLLQKPMPMIPPSYSTLTLTPNTPSSSILFPTAASSLGSPSLASPNDRSPTTNPQQWQSNENQANLPEANSLSCGSSVLHLTVSPHLSNAFPPHTSSYQSLFSSSTLPQNTFTSATDPQTSSQSSSSALTQTGSQHVPSLHSPYPHTSPSRLPSSRED